MLSTTRRTTAVPLLAAALMLGGAGSAMAIPVDDDGPPPPPANVRPNAVLDVSPNPALVSQLLPPISASAKRIVLDDVIGRGRVSFDASRSTDADGTIKKYEWDLDGNGTFETSTTTPRTARSYSQPATLTVRVRVRDDKGATDVAAKTLVVHRPPRAAITAAPQAVLVGQSVALSAAGSSDDDGIAKYDWDLDGNGSFETPTGTTPIASASFATLGSKTVRVRVTDVRGATASAATQVAVHRAPDAAFLAAPSPAAVGERVVFDGSPSTDDEPIARYEWDLDGDGTFETDGGAAPTAARAFTAPGTVTVRLRVTDTRGVQDVVAQPLTVLAQPPADTSAPVVRITAPSTRMSRTGRVTLAVTCPATERLCAGRLSLRRSGGRGASAGSKAFRLGGGQRMVARVKLSRSAQRIVKRRGRLAVRATATARDAAGNAGTARRTLRIRR